MSCLLLFCFCWIYFRSLRLLESPARLIFLDLRIWNSIICCPEFILPEALVLDVQLCRDLEPVLIFLKEAPLGIHQAGCSNLPWKWLLQPSGDDLRWQLVFWRWKFLSRTLAVAGQLKINQSQSDSRTVEIIMIIRNIPMTCDTLRPVLERSSPMACFKEKLQATRHRMPKSVLQDQAPKLVKNHQKSVTVVEKWRMLASNKVASLRLSARVVLL